MSAIPSITSDWTPSETEAPTMHSAGVGKKYVGRRSSVPPLDSYIADYVDHQKRRAETISGRLERATSTVPSRGSPHSFDISSLFATARTGRA